MADFTDEKRNEHYNKLFIEAANAGDVNRVREICNEWGVDNTDNLVATVADHHRWKRFWQAEEKRENAAEIVYLLDSMFRYLGGKKQTLRRYWWN